MDFQIAASLLCRGLPVTVRPDRAVVLAVAGDVEEVVTRWRCVPGPPLFTAVLLLLFLGGIPVAQGDDNPLLKDLGKIQPPGGAGWIFSSPPLPNDLDVPPVHADKGPIRNRLGCSVERNGIFRPGGPSAATI
jgi:hypothetical protein